MVLKGTLHDFRHVDSNIHVLARVDQSGWNRLRGGRDVWIPRRQELDGINTIFLVSTVLTSVTGFGFPFEHLLPSHKVGIISLMILALAVPTRYVFHLAGSWRRIYVVTAAAALYLNVFVLIAQAFMKVPALKALAPTGQEPPFLVAQLVVLLIFVGLTIQAAKRFHIEPARAV